MKVLSFAVLIGCVLFCASCYREEKTIPAEHVKEASPAFTDNRWDRILAMANAKQKTSRDQLEAIAAENNAFPSTQLARSILRAWNDKENTFLAQAPIPISQDSLEKILHGSGADNITIDVDSRGTVVNVRFKSDSVENSSTILLQKRIRTILFCPAKDSKSYYPSSVTYRIIPESF